jgi:hypothetical protein
LENLRQAINTAAASPKKMRYPLRFNWPSADRIQPAALATTESQIQILTSGSHDIMGFKSALEARLSMLNKSPFDSPFAMLSG